MSKRSQEARGIVTLIIIAIAIVVAMMLFSGCSNKPTTAEVQEAIVAQAATADGGVAGDRNHPIPFEAAARQEFGLNGLSYYCMDNHVYRFISYHQGLVPIFETSSNGQDFPLRCK